MSFGAVVASGGKSRRRKVKAIPNLKNAEVARRLSEHLARMENSPVNVVSGLYPEHPMLLDAPEARSIVKGRIHILYHTTHPGPYKILERHEADKYLEWLDAGNQGTYLAFQEATKPVRAPTVPVKRVSR